MHSMIFFFILFVLTRESVARSDVVSSCIAGCINNATNPCDESSLDGLVACAGNKCLTTAAEIPITLTPKVQYSCQESFVPGSNEPSSSINILGDGGCANSPYEFRSFILSADTMGHMKTVAQQCRMTLYPRSDCGGSETKLDMINIQDHSCHFHGGRSVRLQCDDKADNSIVQQTLASMCTNGTSSSANSTTPKASIGVNATAAANGTFTPTASASPSLMTANPVAGLGSKDRVYDPSFAGLVAVIAAALLML